MGQTGQIAATAAQPARVDLLVLDLISQLLEASPESQGSPMQAVLERLGQALGLDRTFLFRLRPDGSYCNSHEWVAPGVPPLLAEMQAVGPTSLSGWDAAFHAGQTVGVDRREDLSPDAPARRLLEAIGVQATLMVPLLDQGRLIGVIGYDSCARPRSWTLDERFLLGAIARAVTSVILRNEATAAEAAARRRLETTLRALPDLVMEVDAGGVILACHSDHLPDLSALVRAGLGQPVAKVLPQPLAEAVAEALAEIALRGTARVRQVGVTVPRAAIGWYEVSVAPQSGVALIVVIRDITASRQASDLASYREGQFTAFFEMCPHPILLNDYDTGQLLDANRAFKRAFGFDPAVLPDLRVRDIMPPDAAWLIDTAVGSMKESGSYGPIEASLRRADDSRFPAVVRGFMSIDPSGRRLVWALIEDITDVRVKEAALLAEGTALAATRARFLAAIEAIDDGFAIFDADDRLVLWNSRYEHLFAGIGDLIREGALYDDLLRAAIERGLFGAEGERDDAKLARRLHRPLTEIWDGEDELADGRLIWARERATPERETVGLYEDVTARRQADRRLQQVVEVGEIAVWDWDADTGLTTMNDRWRTMLGIDAPALQIPDLAALVHLADLGALQAVRQSLFQDGRDDFDLLCRVRHGSGRWLWLLWRGRVLARRADGMPRRISGLALDVTARTEAERQLSRLIDGARLGTWEHYVQDGRSILNDRWAEILGYRASELNPLPLDRWIDLVHPDDFQALLQRQTANFAAGDWRIEHELRLRHRRGHWVWALSRGQVIDSEGRPLHISGVLIDISGAKALEAALARERDTLARIMETSVSGIVAVDGAGKVVFANAAAEAVLGRPVAPGDNLLALLAEAAVTRLDGAAMLPDSLPVALALAGGSGQHDVRHAILWPDGSRHVVSVNAARLSAPGTELAVVCSFTDITEAVENEDRLRTAMTAAEAANRAKSDFLAAMSHEIRTPLNGVLGMANVLLRRTEKAEDRLMLQVIHDSGEHLLAVINDILDLARIEAGRLVLDRRPMDLGQICARVIAVHRPMAEEKGLRLVMRRIGGSEGELRLGDEQRVMQILHNLLGNAVKFTDDGEVVLELDCSTPDRIVLEVRDTGVGMEAAELSQVLEAFTQGRVGSQPRNGGSGLGLAIVRQLAQLMQGEVTLSSAPGQGLTARVDVAMPVARGAAAPTDKRDLPKVPPLRILAAEDNATNRIILGSLLDALGLQARIVASGDEAVALWRAETFDVLLFDIAMPGRDGMATLAALIAEGAARGRPVPPAVAVTANAMLHQVEAYLAQGFVAIVPKPVSLEGLATALIASQAAIGADRPSTSGPSTSAASAPRLA